jgi:hypothetical protein
MPPANSPTSRFSSGVAWEVLHGACGITGLPADGASLLRFGQNAIFLLPADRIVVRVGRSAERLPILERELCVARWLNSKSVPSARPVDKLAQPVEIAGYPVSFWHAERTADPGPGTADLALLLSRFHAAGDSPCDLPRFQPLSDVPDRLAAASNVTERDRDFLRRRADELARSYQNLVFVLAEGPIHGDAHAGNLLGTPGAAVLTDFESTAVGPREWDLTPVAVAHRRQMLSREDYETFTARYGFDVTQWPGFAVLAGVRELGMITWLMQNITEGRGVEREFYHRLESLRNGDDGCAWHVF